MNYRKLGNTGLLVSEVSFGTIPILSGNVPVLPNYYSPTCNEAISIMKYAYELGCNLFDTAIVPEYGDAEIKLGQFANSIKREKIIISDKARFFTGNEMYKAVLESIKNLETYIDIYFVHQVDFQNAEQVFGKYGALAALTELKAEGKIRFTGIASHYYELLLTAAKDQRIDILQGSGNIFECGMLNRIQLEPLMRAKGILINKVFAAGILPSFFSTKQLIHGVLSYPISSALIGIGSKEQAYIALKEYQNTNPDSEQASQKLSLDFEKVSCTLEKFFDLIPCDRCQKCYCNYGTEIHTVFRQYNYYFLGKDYWALRKLDLGIKESAAACKTCTELSCIKQCPRKLRIPELIQKINQFVQIHIRNSRI